jgi:hypothetical protein
MKAVVLHIFRVLHREITQCRNTVTVYSLIIYVQGGMYRYVEGG